MADQSKDYLKQLIQIFRRFITPGGAAGPDTVNVTLGSSSSIIGAVKIDQTTPGTTNGVVINSGTITSITNALPAGTNTIGNVSLVGTSTSNGLSRFRSLTVNSTAQAIKASSGNLYGWNIVNLHTSTIYVKIYNIAAASVNPAADTPILTLMVPPSGSVYQQPDCIQDSLTTAISVRAVTDSGDTGTTAPGTLPIIEIKYL